MRVRECGLWLWVIAAMALGGCGGCGDSHAASDQDAVDEPDGGEPDDGDTGDGDTGDGDTGDGDTGDGDTGDGDTGDGDTGDGDMADPCIGVRNACDEEGAACQNNTLVTCAPNRNGCLVETRRNCARFGTDLCDDTGETPACVAEDDPCADVESPCEEAGTRCDGPHIVTCAEDENGCLVESEVDCTSETDKNTCSDADGAPACSFDACKDAAGSDKADVCVVDQTLCSGQVLVTCTPDADGCPIATRTNCATAPDANRCDGTLETPACVLDPCIEVTNPCLVEGVTCLNNTIVTCAADPDGCLVESVATCTVGETCDDSGGSPACTACSDDPACVDGAGSVCAGNLIQTCADSDGDGCLDVKTEDCGGTDFVCCDGDADPTGCPTTVDTTGCVYAGNDTCASEVAQVLSTMASYAGDTTGGGNDYGNYMCPGLRNPLAGAAEDRLFALDVPPATVITITLTQPPGAPDFSGTGAWMMLLAGCSADAVCEGISRTQVEYTNEGSTTARVYLSVDADTDDTNTGDFGLSVDVRAYGCGDGLLDGSEACDDGNLFAGDGCTPQCALEEGYACTGNQPSVCTRRPTDNVCGNVQCPMLPADAPNGSEVCCTPDERCGVTLSTYYGAGCFARNQEGASDDACPGAESVFALFFPTLPGCCRTDGQCGFRSATGAGCVLRSELSLNLQDGLVSTFYPGPFEPIACTP